MQKVSSRVSRSPTHALAVYTRQQRKIFGRLNFSLYAIWTRLIKTLIYVLEVENKVREYALDISPDSRSTHRHRSAKSNK